VLPNRQRRKSEPLTKAFLGAGFLFLSVWTKSTLCSKAAFFLIVYSFSGLATVPLTIQINRHFSRFAANTGGEMMRGNLSKGDKPWTYFGP
jgi:hypothetical protein